MLEASGMEGGGGGGCRKGVECVEGSPTSSCTSSRSGISDLLPPGPILPPALVMEIWGPCEALPHYQCLVTPEGRHSCTASMAVGP